MRATTGIPMADEMTLFAVGAGATVTAWALSALITRYYPGEPALAEDRVNYRFINGFVDVGDLPCRIALWSEIETRKVELKNDWTVESFNLPGFNRRLDFSGFWHRPTRLARWCRTTLVPPETGDYAFRLATCGGVHIWVDGVLAARFEPFRRNAEQQTDIVLPLRAGGSEIVMLSEDLAERDTNWYVELTALSPVHAGLPVPGGASEADMATLMTLATSVRPEREFQTSGSLRLVFDEPATKHVRIVGRVQQSVHMRDKPPLYSVEALLLPGQSAVMLEGIDALPDGYHPLDLTFEIGGARVERHIGFALLRELAPRVRPETLDERKAEALAYAAAHGELRVGRALAALAGGQPCDGTIEAIILDTLAMIDERRDCSDFVMVPLLWLYGANGDALPQSLAERVRKSILGYRYWVDEPGNDVMWFWSENHVLCFHVSQYLAGRLLPDAHFSASGRTGREQMAVAAARLDKWLTSVESHGLAEWNSAAYYPIDFIGLLALFQWAEGNIKSRSGKLLDRLFTMIALHTLGGVSAGTQGRAYDKELRAGPLTELAPFATVAFGEGWLNDGVAALPMFAAGDYAPPAQLSRHAVPPAGKAFLAHYVQGYETAARLALYKSAAVQLSASVEGGAGKKGHQQHLVDVRFAGHPFARAWVNHPGEDDPWGHQRPSYWAGNGVMPRVGQHHDTALLLFDLGTSPRVDFTHAYTPVDAFDELRLENNWLVLRSGSGFAALTASAPITPVTEGPGARCEFRAHGKRTAWAVLVGELAPRAGLNTVFHMLENVALTHSPETHRAELTRPDRPRLVLDYIQGLSVDGQSKDWTQLTLDPLVTEIGVSPLH
ncbi:hypothetical protein [Pelagibacterium limicola]|uniref:hypothetical protein n=1 Tax=Pelagibacterium limicola TaxID=2791022 RepID=UPI001A9AE6E6|nr:hypothetical protein [Pelagibacterium limicola]